MLHALGELEPLASAALAARAAQPDASLAGLYNPEGMPAALRKERRTLDRAADRQYLRGGFASDRGRVECLLQLHGKSMLPLP